MSAFKIALVGAPDTGQMPLFDALTERLKTDGWPVAVEMADLSSATRYDSMLIMGLDAPLPSTIAADQSIRLALARTGAAYEVLYGTTQERLAQVLQMVEVKVKLVRPLAQPLMQPATAVTSQNFQTEPAPAHKPWVWLCDKCSDAQCEHKLLTQLLTQRATAL